MSLAKAKVVYMLALNNASEENALSLLASAANLLSDNSRVLNLIDIRLRQQETDALILRHKRQTTNV